MRQTAPFGKAVLKTKANYPSHGKRADRKWGKRKVEGFFFANRSFWSSQFYGAVLELNFKGGVMELLRSSWRGGKAKTIDDESR